MGMQTIVTLSGTYVPKRGTDVPCELNRIAEAWSQSLQQHELQGGSGTSSSSPPLDRRRKTILENLGWQGWLPHARETKFEYRDDLQQEARWIIRGVMAYPGVAMGSAFPAGANGQGMHYCRDRAKSSVPGGCVPYVSGCILNGVMGQPLSRSAGGCPRHHNRRWLEPAASASATPGGFTNPASTGRDHDPGERWLNAP